jgi:cytochrome P450
MAVAARPPSPPGVPYLGHILDFAKDPIGFLARASREYGDLVYLSFVGRPAYLVSSAEHVETVLGPSYRSYRKPYSIRTPIVRQLLGNGLVSSEGEFWVRQRRLAQPAFHRERIAAYGRVMVQLAERAVAKWTPGETRDLYAEMMRLTAEIVVQTMFGMDAEVDSEAIAEALDRIMAQFTRQFGVLGILDNVLPAWSTPRFRRILKPLDDTVYRIIREKRAQGQDDGDLLSMLLRAQDEDGGGMTDQQLRDEVMTVFFAGHETTAIALTWTFYLLAQHLEVEEKLRAEVSAVLGGRSPSVDDLPRLSYADCIVREAMRLYPPVWSLGREALEECVVDGYPIPPGAQVVFSQFVLHRDPRYWEEPEEFRPERWADGLAERLPRGAYFPFGGGPRGCIGIQFALMEAVLLLVTVTGRVRLSLAPGQKVTPTPSMTLRPKEGLPMTVRPA